MKTNIYKLIDPRDSAVRYVGKTRKLEERFKNHCNRARIDPTPRSKWLQSLRSQYLKPIMEIIETVPIAEGKFRERFWIKHYLTIGCDLTNCTTDGLSFGNQTSFTGNHRLDVLAFDLSGVLVDTFTSGKDAEAVYGSGVGAVLIKRRKTQKGLVFVYKKEFDGDVENLIKWATTKDYKANKGSFKKGQIGIRSKKVSVEVVGSGELLIFDSVRAAATALNIGASGIQWGCYKGRSINNKKYKVQYI
jgi:hypothetical protein